jgi:hypothetical protein
MEAGILRVELAGLEPARGLEITRSDGMAHLVNRNAGVRRAALRVLVGPMSHEEARALLDDVASSNPRYYDVVGLLDRLVHGPGFARECVREALTAD